MTSVRSGVTKPRARVDQGLFHVGQLSFQGDRRSFRLIQRSFRLIRRRRPAPPRLARSELRQSALARRHWDLRHKSKTAAESDRSLRIRPGAAKKDSNPRHGEPHRRILPFRMATAVSSGTESVVNRRTPRSVEKNHRIWWAKKDSNLQPTD